MTNNDLAEALVKADKERQQRQAANQIKAASRNGDDWAYHQAQVEYHKLTGEFYYEQDRDTTDTSMDN